MKTSSIILTIIAAVMLMASCGASKKAVEKSPVQTSIMPGAEYLSKDGFIRAWGVGKSDNEASARKKARMNATSELAETISKKFNSVLENYTVDLQESDSALSKSLFREKSKMVIDQKIKGAQIIYDRWAKDEKTGQYTNYIVLEIKGEDYINSVLEEVKKPDNNRKSSDVDEELLKRLFLEAIEEDSL